MLYQLSYLAAATQCSPGRGPRVTGRRVASGEPLPRAVEAGRKRDVAIIGAALDLGQGRRGVDMGPSAMRAAGLEERLESLGYEVHDHGNVESPEPEATTLQDERARFLPEIKETCALIADLVAQASADGELPLVLGRRPLGRARDPGRPGSCTVRRRSLIDAHSDINTPETSPSGNVHGMTLAAALGLAGPASSPAWPLPAVEPQRVALLGARSLDEGERRLLREAGIRVFTMSEIDRIGIERAVRESLDRVAGGGSSTSRSTWTSSIRRSHPGWGRRSAAA